MGAEGLLAEPRVCGLRLPLPAAPVRVADGGLHRPHLRPSGFVGAAGRNAGLRHRQHDVRGTHADPSRAPRDGDPQADPRDAVAARDLSRRDVDVDHDRLRAAGGLALHPRQSAQVDSVAASCFLPRADARARGRDVRRPRARTHERHSFARRIVSRRERARAADGVSLRLVRLDPALPAGSTSDRRRAPAQVPARRHQRELPAWTGAVG